MEGTTVTNANIYRRLPDILMNIFGERIDDIRFDSTLDELPLHPHKKQNRMVNRNVWDMHYFIEVEILFIM